MKRFAAVVVLVLAVAAIVALIVLRPRIALIVVNTTAAPVQVAANGHELRLEPGEVRLLEKVAARLSLRARAEGGASLAEIDTSCASGARTWVFSVAPVTTWWEASRGYGDMAHVTTSCVAFAAPGPLFPL